MSPHSVRGTVEYVAITKEGSGVATVHVTSTGATVQVSFPAELADTLFEARANNQGVEVIGRISGLAVESVRVLEEPTISWSDLRGYLPEITGGMSYDDYMEELRPGWKERNGKED